MEMKTVYAIMTKEREVIGDFKTLPEAYACLDRMSKKERDHVDHIFAREVKAGK